MHKTTDCSVVKATWFGTMSLMLLGGSMLWVVGSAATLHAAQIDPRRSLVVTEKKSSPASPLNG